MNQTFQFVIFTLANDHFSAWPPNVTLTFNLPESMFQNNNCATLFWNPCINVEVMARTRTLYDHFIIRPWSVTLTFNRPEQMFQMNNCAELLWNPWITLKSMHKCRSYGPDKFNLWPFYHLTFKCAFDLPLTRTNVSNGPATSQVT